MPEATIPTKEAFFQRKLEAMKAAARERTLNSQQGVAAGAPTGAKVSPFDIDFLFMFFLAVFNDLSDIILFIIGLIGGPTIVIPVWCEVSKKILDYITTVFIGLWMFKKTGQMVKSKRQQMSALQQKVGKTSSAMQQQLQKQLSKIGTKTFGKIASRLGIDYVLEAGVIPFIPEPISALTGLLPCWTITIIMMLRETGD